MKTGLRARDWKIPLAVFACLLLPGCPARSLEGTLDTTLDPGRSHASHGTCPSQDFSIFLQRYAADDSVRRRYTDDPLEHEVPTHTVEDETGSSPPTQVSAKSGDDRLKLFSYRYFPDTGKFARIFPGGDADIGGQPPYPVAITNEPAGGRKVVFGMEYEIDTYMFRRVGNCWHLARAIDLRD